MTNKTKKIPQRLLDSAAKIIAAGNAGVWLERFLTGYRTIDGTQLPPLPEFTRFDAIAVAGADPDTIEAVRQMNIQNLALALQADTAARNTLKAVLEPTAPQKPEAASVTASGPLSLPVAGLQ